MPSRRQTSSRGADWSGPLHPDRYIRSVAYLHACGQPIVINRCGETLDTAGRNLSYYAYDDERRPRCNKRIRIEDLGGRKKKIAAVSGRPTGDPLLKGGVA